MSVVVNRIGVTSDAGRAISQAEAKDHLDVTHGDDDLRILALIETATEYFARVTHCPIVKTDYEMRLRDWHGQTCFELPCWPLHTLTSVEVIPSGSDDFESTSAFETIKRDSVPSQLVLSPDQSLPGLANKLLPIRIRWTAGYDQGNIPASIKHTIKLIVRALYDHPSPVLVGTIAQIMPLSVKSLLNSHKPGHVSGSVPGVIVDG